MATKDTGAPPTPGPHDEREHGRALQPLLADALSAAVRRLVHRSRAELGKAARTGRERLELRQHQKDLDHFWARLGKTAYHLVEGGDIDHPALRKAMRRIDELELKIDDLRRRRGGSDPAAEE